MSESTPTKEMPEVAAATRQLDALERLVRASERRLDESGHAHRVGELAAMLARAVRVSDERVELIRRAAPLHDVGLLGVPDSILLKPGRLTQSEHAQMRRHVEIGVEMLSHGESALLSMGRQIVRSHHERFDGTGYPARLAAHAIPQQGQIVAIADFFDSLTRRRPYRDAWSVADALDKLQSESGKAFNPMLVTTFIEAIVKAGSRVGKSGRRSETAGPTLRGRVDGDTLIDLLLSLANNARSARIGVYAAWGEAMLVVRDGALIHAAYAGATGDEAVVRLVAAIQRTGEMDFEMEPASADSTVTVETPLQRLLFEAAVRFDHDEHLESDGSPPEASPEGTGIGSHRGAQELVEGTAGYS